LAGSGIGSLFICKNRLGPLSGNFDETKADVVISACGRSKKYMNPADAGFSTYGKVCFLSKRALHFEMEGGVEPTQQIEARKDCSGLIYS